MLLSLKDLNEFCIHALDGEAGIISDFYFDQKNWIVKYLVDKTKSSKIQIPITINSVRDIDWKAKMMYISSSIKQIESSPKINNQLPINREQENKLASHYGWKMTTDDSFTDNVEGAYYVYQEDRNIVQDQNDNDDRLRSCQEVIEYNIETNTGKIGHVEDFIVNDVDWSIRYMVIDTNKFLNKKKILIAPEWIDWIRWDKRSVSVNIEKNKILGCPDFNLAMPIKREYEDLIYDHYECKKYWQE